MHYWCSVGNSSNNRPTHSHSFKTGSTGGYTHSMWEVSFFLYILDYLLFILLNNERQTGIFNKFTYHYKIYFSNKKIIS